MILVGFVFIIALIESSIGQNDHCDVMCMPGVYPIVKENQCVCSPGFPGSYSKGDICTVRLSVNKEKRVKLKTSHFNLRYGPDCNQDRLKFRNMHNRKNPAHYMRKVCRRHQMIHDTYIVVNSPQVRMDFRAPNDGKAINDNFWRVCLTAPYSPNNFKTPCPFTMDHMEIGFNRRQAEISSNISLVNEICCTSTGFTSKDDAYMMCEPQHIPKIGIRSNGKPACLTCSSSHPRVSVEADISGSVANKMIHCTCATEEGIPIGGNCAGGRKCLDLKDTAFCDTNNTCKCPAGRAPDPTNSYCGPVVNLGDHCLNGEVCTSTNGLAICNGTICVCTAHFEPDFENNACVQRALIGESCAGGKQCMDINNMAYCDVDGDSTCKCPEEYVPADTRDTCLPLVDLGASCANSEVCHSSNGFSICNGTICVCQSGYQGDIGNNICNPLAGVGEDCSSGEVCQSVNGLSTCNGDICVCPNGYQADESHNICRKLVVLGEDCSDGQVCISKNNVALCNTTTSTCGCPSGYEENIPNNVCLEFISLGESCTSDFICVDSKNLASCEDDVCVCPDGYAPNANKEACVPAVLIGESCTNGEVCADTYGRAHCNGLVCVCPDGFKADPTRKSCKKVISLGEDCSSDTICVDSNDLASCDWVDGDHVCVCPDGFAPNANKEACVPAVLIGESCANGEVCADTYGRAQCDGSICVCPSTFEPNPTRKFCKKDVPIDSYCTHGIFCIDSLGRATCKDNKCSCPAGTTALPATTKQYCSLDSEYGQNCEDQKDCTQSRSKKCNLITKKCVCESPFVYHKEVCSRKSMYGETCSFDKDCWAEAGICKNSVCRCPYHHDNKNDIQCIPYCQQKRYNGVAKKFYLNAVVCNKQQSNKCYACKCDGPPGAMRVIDTNTAAKRVCQKMKKCHGKPQTEIPAKVANKCGE